MPRPPITIRSLYSLYGAPLTPPPSLSRLFHMVEDALLTHEETQDPWALRYARYRDACGEVATFNTDLILMFRGEEAAGELGLTVDLTQTVRPIVSPVLDFGASPGDQGEEVKAYRRRLAKIFPGLAGLWAIYYDTWLQMTIINEEDKDTLAYLERTWLHPQCDRLVARAMGELTHNEPHEL